MNSLPPPIPDVHSSPLSKVKRSRSTKNVGGACACTLAGGISLVAGLALGAVVLQVLIEHHFSGAKPGHLFVVGIIFLILCGIGLGFLSKGWRLWNRP